MTTIPTKEQSAIVEGEYITFKHVKTRKVVILEIEVAEELFQHVLNTLGMPIGGESKPVAVALLDKGSPELGDSRAVNTSISSLSNNSMESANNAQCNSEGDKLRVRAVMLCNDSNFQQYIMTKHINLPDGVITYSLGESATYYIYQECNIKSRSELTHNPDAQMKFRTLDQKFKDWLYENQHSDNISRM